jgi:hypothetical protein
MPENVFADDSAIDSLDGIGEFDWTTTPTTYLGLASNRLSSIKAGVFSRLTNVTQLNLEENPLSSIEAGGFGGLVNLRELNLEENQLSSIEPGAFAGLPNLQWLSLNGNQISNAAPGGFGGLVNLRGLELSGNQFSSIASGNFSGLWSLTQLYLSNNQLTSTDSGAFSGLPNLKSLWLSWNEGVVALNLADADFSSLGERLDFLSGRGGLVVEGNEKITSVSLRNTVVNQTSLAGLLDGGSIGVPPKPLVGIGDLDGISEMDLSGIDFRDIHDLGPLYVMDDLADLWLVDTQNLDAFDLDVLLDNLETIEGIDTEGVLYMTEADFDAFNAAGDGLLAAWDAEPGHHVEFLQLGDVNHDTMANGLDVDPFLDVLFAGRFDVAADTNGDGFVNGLDIDPFVAVVVGGTHQIPEPSTLLLCLVALGVVGGWRKWRRGA